MSDAAQRLRALRAQATVGVVLLDDTALAQRVATALDVLGQASDVSRVYVFEVLHRNGEESVVSQRYEWVADGIEAQIDNPELQEISWLQFADGRWKRELEAGHVVSGPVSGLPVAEREILAAQDIKSVLVMPIFVGSELWGFIGFDDCTSEREWLAEDFEPLQVSAQALGAALQRDRVVAALHASESRFRLLAEHTDDLICLHEPDGQFVYISPSFERLLGYPPERLGHTDPYQLIHPDDRARVRETLHEPVLAGAPNANVEYRFSDADGHYRWLETRARPVFDDRRKVVQVVSSSRDVTRRREAEQRVVEQMQELETTLQSIADGVVTVAANGCVEYMNPAAELLTGWTREEAFGQRVEQVLLLHADSLPELARLGEQSTVARHQKLAGQTVQLITRGGAALQVQFSAAARDSRGGDEAGIVLAFRDVSEASSLANELAWRASHDSLTGLLNRAEFDQRLNQVLSEARANDKVHALLYLDLDQFKVVNDTCGHAAGDQLIRQLPATLREVCGEDDLLARLGGDEFGLILRGSELSQAVSRAERLLDALRRFRFQWGERNFQIGGSIGLVQISAASESAEQLLIAADSACYLAKERGRNRVQIYESDNVDVSRLHDELHWIGRLETALDLDDFRLLGQEIRVTASADLAATRFEVLLALPDARGNLVSPGLFLPAAQRYGLIGRIDRWVVSQVVDRLLAHEQSGAVPFDMVAVNLSGSSLGDEHFIEYIDQRVSELKHPQQLCFEITETEAVANLGLTSQLLRQLRARGCRFALDDFGSGLSSFGYLKNLPVDIIKIDGQFVRDCIADRTDLAMVEAIHRIGQVMGLQTIAEFVESAEILTRMVDVGVDYAQGFHLGRPRPLESFGL